MKKHNPWKGAFWLLVTLLLLGSGFVVTQVTGPLPVAEETRALKPSPTSFELTLDKDQVNALAANYLNRFLKDRRVRYRFVVGSKYATIIGKTKLLGAPVQFALNMVPERTRQGNVLLRAKGLVIGRLNLPVKEVLAWLSRGDRMPAWVHLNPKQATILLDLNQYSRHHALKYQAKQINMAKGQFQFLITIPDNQR